MFRTQLSYFLLMTPMWDNYRAQNSPFWPKMGPKFIFLRKKALKCLQIVYNVISIVLYRLQEHEDLSLSNDTNIEHCRCPKNDVFGPKMGPNFNFLRRKKALKCLQIVYNVISIGLYRLQEHEELSLSNDTNMEHCWCPKNADFGPKMGPNFNFLRKEVLKCLQIVYNVI